MAKPRNWKECEDRELPGEIEALKKELFSLKSEYKFAKKVEKPHKLRSIRRDIARAYTEKNARKILSEREMTPKEEV